MERSALGLSFVECYVSGHYLPNSGGNDDTTAGTLVTWRMKRRKNESTVVHPGRGKHPARHAPRLESAQNHVHNCGREVLGVGLKNTGEHIGLKNKVHRE